MAERVSLLAAKPNPTPEDFQIMSDLIRKIMRLDKSMDGTVIGAIAHNMPFIGLSSHQNENTVVGKIIGASLAYPKINSNVEKILGQLERSGEDMEALRQDPEKLKMLERVTLLDYNLGENKELLGSAENYILRIIDKAGIIQKRGGTMKYPEIQSDWLTGSMTYGVDTFIGHVLNMGEALGFSDKAKMDWNKLDKHGLPEYRGPEFIILSSLWEFRGKIMDASQQSSRTKREGMVQKAIYELTSNKELRTTLDTYAYDPRDPSKRISSCLLPTQEVFSSNSFAKTFFNYIRKGDEAEKLALAKEKTKLASK